MNKREKLKRAAEKFRTLAMAPGIAKWTEEVDAILRQVAREFRLTEDELFGELVASRAMDLPGPEDPSPIVAISPRQYQELWKALVGEISPAEEEGVEA